VGGLGAGVFVNVVEVFYGRDYHPLTKGPEPVLDRFLTVGPALVRSAAE